jgi:hypothetical protein
MPKIAPKIHKKKTCYNMETISECTDLIKTFQKGGTPGLSRLKQVIPNIFKELGIKDFNKQIEILVDVGLSPYIHKDTKKCHVSFKLPHLDFIE